MGQLKTTFTGTVVLYGKPHPVVVMAENLSEASQRIADIAEPDIAKATAPTAAPDAVQATVKSPTVTVAKTNGKDPI